MKKISIICRCEDVDEEEAIKAIDEGCTDLEELRKKLRIGMGPCQGRICIPLVIKILEKKTGEKISLPTSRPPIVPVSLGTLASDNHEE
ncbi:NAD(P)H-nitrite reductase [Thermoplasmatales archaeon SCGC AB-539-N05]|nr:NAD(P)H-nitrite reductase [Thermoplasmatales archaeon SCGC AB-539-N05]ENO11801.1 NAD(P)H-nitrite reductase [Thermoplasmatales archaeon SCGC AB-539-C06]